MGVKGGVEAVPLAIRQLLERDPSKVVISFDARNAFNSLLRSKMLPALRKHAPGLSPMAEALYGQAAPLWFLTSKGVIQLFSECGVMQGDPLAGLYFAIGLKDSLEHIADHLKQDEALFAFLDDIFLVVDLNRVAEVTQVVKSELGTLNLDIRLDKSHVYSPNTPIPPDVPVFPPWSQEGIVVLGTPIGTDKFVNECLNERLGACQLLLDRIPDLDDLQSELLLLRLCANTKLGYWGRTTPPSQLTPAALLFDAAIEKALVKVVGDTFEDECRPFVGCRERIR